MRAPSSIVLAVEGINDRQWCESRPAADALWSAFVSVWHKSLAC